MTMVTALQVRPMRRRIRFMAWTAQLVVVSVTILGVMSVPVAASNEQPTVQWKGRSDQLSGTVPLRAEVSTGEPVDGWVVRGFAADDELVFDPICSASFRRARSSFEVRCRWDTTRYTDSRWSSNQHYRLRLEARRGDEESTLAPDRDMTVVNRPAAPAKVKARYEPDQHMAAIAWAANPEPDIEHYEIEERIDEGPWEAAGRSTAASFERALSESGKYRFRVAVQRRGIDGGPSLLSDWSPASNAVRTSNRPESKDDQPSEPQPQADRRPAASAESPSPRQEEQDQPVTATAESTGPAGDSSGTSETVPGDTTQAAEPRRAPIFPEHDSSHPTGVRPTFSASSNGAFEAVGQNRPAPPPPKPSGLSPRSSPSLQAEANDGFEPALRYPEPSSDPDADAYPATESEEAWEPFDPTSVSPNDGRPGVRLGRLAGMVLVVGGLTLMALAVQPRCLRRRVRHDISPAEPTQRSLLAEIEARLGRLEKAYAEGHTDPIPMQWELPTG